MRKIIYKKVWDAIDFLAVTMQSQMPRTFNYMELEALFLVSKPVDF